eukprot:scaffold1476_cov115-Isochrysis_galbana.AAC.4
MGGSSATCPGDACLPRSSSDGRRVFSSWPARLAPRCRSRAAGSCIVDGPPNRRVASSMLRLALNTDMYALSGCASPSSARARPMSSLGSSARVDALRSASSCRCAARSSREPRCADKYDFRGQQTLTSSNASAAGSRGRWRVAPKCGSRYDTPRTTSSMHAEASAKRSSRTSGVRTLSVLASCSPMPRCSSAVQKSSRESWPVKFRSKRSNKDNAACASCSRRACSSLLSSSRWSRSREAVSHCVLFRLAGTTLMELDNSRIGRSRSVPTCRSSGGAGLLTAPSNLPMQHGRLQEGQSTANGNSSKSRFIVRDLGEDCERRRPPPLLPLGAWYRLGFPKFAATMRYRP